MAKTKRLIILIFFLIPGAVLAGTKNSPGYITATVLPVTATVQAFAVCVTMQSAAECVTIQASPLDVTQTTDYLDNIINLKVKELNLNITPYFKVVLPDASIDLGLKQKIGDTTLEGETEYNYIYNKIKYSIKYGLETYFPVYVRLYDDMQFEQIYNNNKYIQRTKGLGLSIGTPVLFSILKVGEEFKNENAYLARLNNSFEVEQGLVSILNTWMEMKITGKQRGGEFDVLRLNVNFDKAIPHKYSAYNFLFLNSLLASNLRFENGNNLLFNMQIGYMLEAQNVPLWKIYNLGGYDSLIGYGLNEFQDYYLISGRLRYDSLIADNIGWEWWWLRMDNLKAFAIVDCGRTGNVYQMQEFNHYKYGAGVGISFQFTFRKRTPIKVTLALGQAIQLGRPPVVYFIYELL